MKQDKRKKLEAGGWRVGSTSQFLGLSESEAAFVDLKLSLAQCLKQRRAEQAITQADLAEAIGSSQSRIAKMESAAPDVTIDLLVRALLALGVSRQQLGRIISKSRSAA